MESITLSKEELAMQAATKFFNKYAKDTYIVDVRKVLDDNEMIKYLDIRSEEVDDLYRFITVASGCNNVEYEECFFISSIGRSYGRFNGVYGSGSIDLTGYPRIYISYKGLLLLVKRLYFMKDVLCQWESLNG